MHQRRELTYTGPEGARLVRPGWTLVYCNPSPRPPKRMPTSAEIVGFMTACSGGIPAQEDGAPRA